MSGTDYTTANGTLTFGNNETSKTFTVSVTNNPLPQGNKAFKVTLSNATANSNITSPSTATVTILDNQSNASSTSGGTASASSFSNPAGTIGLSATAYLVNEKGGSLTVTINRTGGSTGTVGISYGTSNGTAVSGAEYTGVSGTLTFNAGETVKTFVIPIINNSAVTGNKAFSVVIGTPTGGVSLSTTASTVTVFDNESGTFGSGTVKMVKDTYNVSKASGYVDVGVQRTGGANGTVSVNYTTTPLTASAGVDYTSTNGTVVFAPGEATKLVRVYITKTVSVPNCGVSRIACPSHADGRKAHEIPANASVCHGGFNSRTLRLGSDDGHCAPLLGWHRCLTSAKCEEKYAGKNWDEPAQN